MKNPMANFNFYIHHALNKLRDKLLFRFPWLISLAYCTPFSPIRGITWHLLDKSTSSMLDIGPFWGAVGRLLRMRGKKRYFLVGMDVNYSYLTYCKKKGLYDGLVLADGRYMPFRSDSFDVILALEVIEHLTKDEGMEFLKDLDRVNRRQVIISTPIGFTEMYDYHSESQKHLSGWFPSEFQRIEYKVRGSYGIRFFPRDLAYWISYLWPLDYYFPQCAYNMICVKKKNA